MQRPTQRLGVVGIAGQRLHRRGARFVEAPRRPGPRRLAPRDLRHPSLRLAAAQLLPQDQRLFVAVDLLQRLGARGDGRGFTGFGEGVGGQLDIAEDGVNLGQLDIAQRLERVELRRAAQGTRRLGMGASLEQDRAIEAPGGPVVRRSIQRLAQPRLGAVQIADAPQYVGHLYAQLRLAGRTFEGAPRGAKQLDRAC